MTPQLGPTPHPILAWNGATGACVVRVYAATQASGGLPVVILTEPNNNPGPSVTNALQRLAAEVVRSYLPQQDGAEPPCVLVEHYPDRQPRGRAARYHDPFFGETFDLVTFASWRLARRGMPATRLRLEHVAAEPQWQQVDRAEVERLVGGELDGPACTCQVRAPAEVGA